jgi:hypothetical protein
MPSVILHTMFGEDLVSALRGSLPAEKILDDFRSAFVLGCQGPDIFYHNLKSKPVALQYGSLLHRRGYGIFSANLLNAGFSGAQKNEHGAYALGFLTHAVLDRACHPFIIYHCGRNYHSFFERIIDTLMLKKLRGLEPAFWDQERLLAETCENPPPGLKESIAASLARTFPEKAGKDRNLARRIDNAFIDCARFYSMSSPSKIKEALAAATGEKPLFSMRALNYVYPENLPGEIDFLNLNRKPWRYPHIPADGEMPEEDTRSFPEIYSDALKFAIGTLAPLFTSPCGAFSPRETAERIGNGCLSIQDENGKPCAANLTDPLPLDEVIKQQVKLRGVE